MWWWQARDAKVSMAGWGRDMELVSWGDGCSGFERRGKERGKAVLVVGFREEEKKEVKKKWAWTWAAGEERKKKKKKKKRKKERKKGRRLGLD